MAYNPLTRCRELEITFGPVLFLGLAAEATPLIDDFVQAFATENSRKELPSIFGGPIPDDITPDNMLTKLQDAGYINLLCQVTRADGQDRWFYGEELGDIFDQGLKWAIKS